MIFTFIIIIVGPGPDTFWDYFDRRYPLLLSTVYKLFTIPLATRYDVNFGEFYETKSVETVSRLVQREIERSDLEHERAKEKGRKSDISVSRVVSTRELS